jgi:hypothetical protein
VSLDDVMVRLDGIVSLLGGNQYNSSKISLRGSTDTKVTPSTDSSMMDKLMAIASGNNVKEEQKTTLTAKEQTILSQISGLTSGYKKSHWEDGEEYTPKQMFARNGVDYLRDEY